jgi:hypothetical protein
MCTMYNLKIIFPKKHEDHREIRRVKIQGFMYFVKFLAEHLEDLNNEHEYVYYYQDYEKDWVAFSSEKEWELMNEFAMKDDKETIKVCFSIMKKKCNDTVTNQIHDLFQKIREHVTNTHAFEKLIHVANQLNTTNPDIIPIVEPNATDVSNYIGDHMDMKSLLESNAVEVGGDSDAYESDVENVPVDKDECMYKKQIDILQSMGFHDDYQTELILNKHKGNVQLTIGELLHKTSRN